MRLSVIAFIAFIFFAPVLLHAEEDLVSINIDPKRVIGALKTDLFGANVPWVDNGGGLFNGPPNYNMNREALVLLDRLRPSILRFPGGILASSYQWKDGIGKQEQRPKGIDFLGRPADMVFGTDEFIQLLERLKCEGLITVNIRLPIDDTIAWINYVNSRTALVRYWELGNEPFLPADPSYTTTVEYMAFLNEILPRLKNETKNIKIGIPLEGTLYGLPWAVQIAPESAQWNKVLIDSTAETVDFYSLHLFAPMECPDDEESCSRLILAAPVQIEKNLAEIASAIRQANPKTGLFVTEFNLGLLEPKLMSRWTRTPVQANFIAQLLMAFVRQKVDLAAYWSLVENNEFGMFMIKDGLSIRPIGRLYGALRRLAGAQALAVDVKAPPIEYIAAGTVPEGLKIKAVDALAFRKGTETALLTVNRKTDQNLKIKVTIDNKPGTIEAALLIVNGRAFDESIPGRPLVSRPIPVSEGMVTLPAAGTALLKIVPAR